MIHVLCPRITIELRSNNEKLYEAGSLLKRIGGFAAYYYHRPESAFEGLSVQGRERLITPTALTQDNSNYL